MDIPQILFGSHEKTTILDADGSTETTIQDFRDGKPKYPVRHRMHIRERAYGDDEAKAKYEAFQQALIDNPDMLDPQWLPKERSKDGDANGYYYVVKSYTLLEY